MRDDILQFTVRSAVREAVRAEVEPVVRKVSEKAAQEAIQATLKSLGMDAGDHKQMQADMLYLRKLRTGSEFISRKILATGVSVMAGAGLWMAWEALKAAVQR